MDPVLLVGVPGVLGGLVMALIMFLRQRRSSRMPSLGAPVHSPPLSTDIINASSIKVAGVGGLGLVAMAVAVALDVPRIGQTVGAGLILGIAFAVAMIVARRRTGSMPSSGRQAGANTTLAIDAATADDSHRTSAPEGPLDLAVTRA